MFDAIGNFLVAAKDKAFEASVTAFLNHEIKAFGSITSLTMDRRLRKASLTVELMGESVPVCMEIGSYDVVEQNGRTCIRVQQVTANREWLNEALKHYLVGRLLPLPSNVIPFLK